MKHPASITAVLILLFVVSQCIGLGLLYLNQNVSVDANGMQEVTYDTTAVGDRPDLSGGMSFLFLIVGVFLGTMVLLLLIKTRSFKIWKAWFTLAVGLALTVAFGVIMPFKIAMILGIILAIWKVFRPNMIVHNLTEVFIYAGIAVLLAPLFDLVWAVLLLIVISLYDMYAVWKSKHMVTLAKAQTESNMFAGLYIPKGKKVKISAPPKPGAKQATGAILGGGDIAFPLLFSGAVLTWLIQKQVPPLIALYQTLIVTVCAAVALSLLFWKSKKDRFYPAMPFLTLGCFVGLGVILLL